MKKTTMMMAVVLGAMMTASAFAAEVPAEAAAVEQNQIIWGDVVVAQPVVGEDLIVLPEEVPAIDEEMTVVPEEIPAIDEEMTVVPEELPAIDEEMTVVPEELPAIDDEMLVEIEETEIPTAALLQITVKHVLVLDDSEIVTESTVDAMLGDLIDTAALSCLTAENEGILAMTGEAQTITVDETTAEIVLYYAFV